MEDVGRVPAELAPANLEPATIPTLDGWIESLMNCKQLAEVDVQRLCEKVRLCFTPMLFPAATTSWPRSSAKPSPRLPAERRSVTRAPYAVGSKP